MRNPFENIFQFDRGWKNLRQTRKSPLSEAEKHVLLTMSAMEIASRINLAPCDVEAIYTQMGGLIGKRDIDRQQIELALQCLDNKHLVEKDRLELTAEDELAVSVWKLTDRGKEAIELLSSPPDHRKGRD